MNDRNADRTSLDIEADSPAESNEAAAHDDTDDAGQGPDADPIILARLRSEQLRSMRLALVVNGPNIGSYSHLISPTHTLPIYYLSHIIYREAEIGNFLTKMKLAYEISPEMVSESTAIRIINAMVDAGFLKEDGSVENGRGRAARLYPTERFYENYLQTLERTARTFSNYGFEFKEQNQKTADLVLYVDGSEGIVSAYAHHSRLPDFEVDAAGRRLQEFLSQPTIERYGGPEGFSAFFAATFDTVIRGRALSAYWEVSRGGDGSIIPCHIQITLGRHMDKASTLRISLTAL